MAYKLLCEDKNYNEWSVVDSLNLEKIIDHTTTADDLADCGHYKKFNNFNPVSEKLLNGDLFNMNDDSIVHVTYSVIKNLKKIPGVMILEKNKTFGKIKTKFLYRCISDDKRIPEFLVPYLDKSPSFSKQKINKFVLFKFREWKDKHPIAELVNTIGTVNHLPNFYEYQLYCKSLYASIQDFTKKTLLALKTQSEEQYIIDICRKHKIEDRQDWTVFTIDPVKSKDFDDALSIKTIETPEKTQTIISIYIANVSLWMDALDLWDSFSERIATIYLPDHKRPMLPSVLSDCLCSLIEQQQRFAFTLDIMIEDSKIHHIEFKNTLIKVSKNFRYEEPALKEFPQYKQLFKMSTALRENYKSIYKVRDSHELVGFLMVMMNHYSAIELTKMKSGIYRSVKLTTEVRIPMDLPDNVFRFIQGWNSSGGKYVAYKDIEKHELMDLDSYVHITSPIRRLVDLLNILQLQHNKDMVLFTEKSEKFYNKWMNQMDYINTTMRAIRKVQSDCSLLALCSENKEFLDKTYSGYVFDKISRANGFNQMFVYLPEINMTSRFTTVEELPEYSRITFKLFLFQDEHNIKKKIRIMKVDE